MISYGASSVFRTLEGADSEVERYNHQLVPIGRTIDEIALLVADSVQAVRLDSLLCLDFGWRKFNSATDQVKTLPIRSAYSVEYTFYEHPDKSYRLEIMRLLSGVSPLHAAIPLPLDRAVCTPVHASFKCADEETYAVGRYYLGEIGYTEAQRCDSTYGRFSYFTTMGAAPCRVPYLKPRVNLRDAEL